MPLSDLATQPFAAQLELLASALEAGAPPVGDVLAAAAALRDHEPLAWAIARLAARDALGAPDVSSALAGLLRSLPDTGIARVLRGLEPAAVPTASRAALVACVRDALGALPVERIAASCLLHRWLRRAAPDDARAVTEAAFATCRAALAADDPRAALEALGDEAFVHVSGRSLRALGATARELGAHAAEALAARLGRFAARVLDVLEAQPKSLSQANAEEILARRVYTDAGHFLVELLQNADDAGAQQFSVEVHPREVHVAHDGAPFDARDVVGVLSIGQTTKQQGQIGFFGVGFKSVYDVCDRPQVYSETFRFEIADVSLPRRLAARPGGEAQGETLLVLPLRAPDDAKRGAAALYDRALALPPETLLTLSSVRTLRVARGDAGRTVTAAPASESARVELRGLADGAIARYLVESAHVALDAPGEAPAATHRAPESPVLVAIALDADGAPTPRPPGAPAVYSYLPTAERAGLRVLVHAHFDVPVDRERLDASSPRNARALEHAGRLLARACARLADEHDAGVPGAAARLDALPAVLPLPTELPPHAAYGALFAALRAGLGTISFLPGAVAATRLAPDAAVRCDDPRLARALAGVPLDAAGQRFALDAALAPRTRALVDALGVPAFDTRELLELLERTLAPGPTARPLTPPAWLARALPAVLDALGDAAESDAPTARLAALPLLPGADGALYAAAWKTVFRASDPRLRAVYEGAARALLAPALDARPTPAQARLLARLEVPALGLDELTADLCDATARAHLAHGDALLEYLAAQPALPAATLCALPIFRDEHGALRPLRAASDREPAPAWIAGDDALGRFVQAMRGARPALVDPALVARFAALFVRLGAQVLDGTALARGDAAPTRDDLPALYAALRAAHADLAPRVAESLARAPLWPDARGDLAPLRGPGCAFWTAETAISAFWPAARWLDAEVCPPPDVLTALGARPVSAAAALRALLACPDADDPPGAFDAAHPALFALLARRRDELPAALVATAAARPIFRAVDGSHRALGALRRAAADDALEAFYTAWSARPEIAPDALALARALGLEARIATPGYDALIDDLVAAGDALELDARARDALDVVLGRVRGEVAPARLAALARARVFPAASGARGALGSWDAPAANGVHRGGEPALRAALALGSRALFAADVERELGGVLDALGARPPTAWDLVRAIAAGELAPADPPSAALVRRALRAAGAALASHPDASTRLSALALWPTRDGRIVPAGAVVRAAALAAALGADGPWDALGDAPALLAADAEPDADALAAVVRFRSPAAFIVARIEAEAVPGAALAAQPAWLAQPERVAALAARLAHAVAPAALAALPLVVDIAGRLVAGPRFAIIPEGESEMDTAGVLEGLALYDQLADPRYAAALAAAAPAEAVAMLAPPLGPRRVAEALADDAREEVPAASHPRLADPRRRARVYRWILAHREALAADTHARGVLARACLLASAQGYLRAPASLLLEPDLPDLGVDWNAAREVPLELRQWLRAVYRLDARRLVPLVEHLLAGYDAALEGGDGARADELLGFLARSLRDPARELEALPKHLKLHRRLRVLADDGAYHRPREVLAPRDRARVAAVLAVSARPPALLAARYDGDEAVRALLAALGAPADLDATQLRALLDGDGLAPGGAAKLALARYVAARASETPALRGELALDRRAWVPDVAVTFYRPAELYWPAPELDALLAYVPEARAVHPEVVRTVPASFGEWLPFRHAAQLAPGVLCTAALRDGERAPEPVLDWLDAGLAAGRLSADEVARGFAQKRCLLDDGDVLRAPDGLFLEDPSELLGRRAGGFAGGAARHPRLARALGITHAPTARDVHAHLARVGRDVGERGAAAVLRAEPELESTVPAGLAFLAARRTAGLAPTTLALYAEDLTGESVLTTTGDPALFFPAPDALLAAVRDAPDAALLLAVVPPTAAPAGLEALLRAHGVRSLDDAFRPHLAAPPTRDLTALYAPAVRALEERLTALFRVLPALLARVVPDAHARAARLRAPDELRVVPDDEPTPGALGALVLAAPRACSLDADRGRLWVTPAALDAPDLVADELGRRVFADDVAARARLTPHLAAMLACDDEPAMRARAALAPAGQPAPPSAAPLPALRSPSEVPSDNVRNSEQSSGLLGRFRKWLGSPAPAPEAKPVAPPPATAAPPPGAEPIKRPGWFTPRDVLEGATNDARGWLADRASRPHYAVAFAPRALPAPYVYGPQLVADRFDRRTQRWSADADLSFARTLASRPRPDAPGARVAFEGRLPAGHALLPLPVFASLVAFEADAPDARLLTDRDGQALLAAPRDTVVRYTAALDPLPVVTDSVAALAALAARAPPALLARTADDADLPAEAHDLVDDLVARDAPPLARVVAVREFVRTRYRYDADYLEDPGLVAWLTNVSRGRANARIAALHAGRDATHLGRGVCFELNSLCCELLRRARVPAVVCSGWVFARGEVSDPDHFWAGALLPTSDGPRVLPVDASATREGRPLQTARQPAGEWHPRARAQTAALPRAPEWAVPPPRSTFTPADDPAPASASRFSRAERRAAAAHERRTVRPAATPALPTDDLVRVARHLEALTGRAVAPDAATLRARCAELLTDPRLGARLAALLGDDA